MLELMDFGPSEARRECALDLRDRCGDSIIFGNPSLLRTCLRFPYCPFWDISHVMFISFCSVSYYLMNRYFPHVLHQRGNVFRTRSLPLVLSLTFYDRFTTRLKCKRRSYLVYRALFVRLCVVTDVSVLFPVSHLTVTADRIAYL